MRAFVADFGVECAARPRVGDAEASISPPVSKLLESVRARWKSTPRLHPEYPLPEARVRPDYVVETAGRITGFLVLKAPGHDVTPDGFTKRDREHVLKPGHARSRPRTRPGARADAFVVGHLVAA